MKVYGSRFDTCRGDRLGLGPGCAPSRAMIGSVSDEDGAHCHLLKKVDYFQSFS